MIVKLTGRVSGPQVISIVRRIRFRVWTIPGVWTPKTGATAEFIAMTRVMKASVIANNE